MRLMRAVVTFCLVASPLLAKADTVVPFVVSDTNDLAGVVVINVTRGRIATSALTLEVDGSLVTLTGSGGSRDGLTGFDLLYFTDTDSYQLLLSSPNSDGTLKGYTGGEFFFSDANGEISTSGDLTPAPLATQPEPASLLLLATGMVAMGGLVWRRRHGQQAGSMA